MLFSIDQYYSVRMHVMSHHDEINCKELIQLADEISALVGCAYDRLGYILLHPDYDFKDLGRMMVNTKKNREKFAKLSIPIQYYGNHDEFPCSPSIFFERAPKNKCSFPIYDIRFKYPCISEGYMKISIDIKAGLLSHGLTLAEFATLQSLVQDKGFVVDTAYIHHYIGASNRAVLEGIIGGVTTWNDYRIITHSENYLRNWKNRVMDIFYMNAVDRALVSNETLREIQRIVGSDNIMLSGEKVLFKLPQRPLTYLVNRLISTSSRTKIKKLLESEGLCEKDASVLSCILRL